MNDISINLQAIANALPEQIQQALDRAGYIVENKAKENCPVDSGILRASISHEATETECVIGTNVEYAEAVHEGHGRYAGVPFLDDALNNSIAEIQNEFSGLLER